MGLIAGANAVDTHVIGFDVSRELGDGVRYVDVREVRLGDACTHCDDGAIEHARGIEVGQVFALGQQYTEPMEVLFQDANGKRATATMGCYGIGVSRLMAAVIEQCHDEQGIVWPLAIAPFQVSLITMGKSERVLQASETIYRALLDAGVEVLWDERKERPGVKFKDAELMGMPYQLVLGERSLDAGIVEMRQRGGDKEECALDAAVPHLLQLLEQSN